MAYLDPSQFDIQHEENGIVATGYFDNGVGVRLEQHIDGWFVYSLIPEGWPDVTSEGDYVDSEPEVFDDLDDALGYMEEIQAL